MTERFEADFSRQYRLAVNGAVPLGLAVAAGASYLSGLSLVAGATWALAITIVLLAWRWILLGVAYEVGHRRLTIARGPFRTRVQWDDVVRMRHGHDRQHGVGGFVLERRDGGTVTVAPARGGRFIRAVATHAPHVRFAWEPGGASAAPPTVVSDAAPAPEGRAIQRSQLDRGSRQPQ